MIETASQYILTGERNPDPFELLAGYPTDSQPSHSVVYPDPEVARLRRMVRELSWDEPFGMWTRNAFLLHCRSLTMGLRQLIFIDLDDIGLLNNQLGYQEVDRRICSAFSACRHKHIVARWYSGDEIVILLSPGALPAPCHSVLQRAAAENGLSFVSASGTWDTAREPVESAVQTLSSLVNQKKLIIP